MEGGAGPAAGKRAREENPNRNKQGRRGRAKKSRAAPPGTDTYSDPSHQPGKKTGAWATAVRKNDVFDAFYRSMNFFATDEEFEQFIAVLKTDLPSTFRITSTSSFAKLLRDKIFKFQHEVEALQDLGEKITAGPIPWYPGDNAWFFSFSRFALRKSAVLKKYHHFIVTHSDVGNISRQEMVSMIPPFFLRVEPHHRVLDMCAAPGSKSAQLIEFLHQVDFKPTLQAPTGVMIANDVDDKRCYMLVHQLKRLGSPSAMMTNYPAQGFPIVKLVRGRDLATLLKKPSEQELGSDDEEDEQGYTAIDELHEGDKYFLFDRILCDVPCSGDGTLRKNYDLWFKWHPRNPLLLHSLQVKITTRAARLLKIGGRMVYSTCSFHPAEDEAVVAEVLRRSQGALELVDVSGELPELKRCPGISSWKIVDSTSRPGPDMEVMWYSKYEDVPQHRRRIVFPSCFPPENVESLHLERCVRIFPHLQDSGGFFIAVLQKVGPMPPPPKRESPPPQPAQEQNQAEAKEVKEEKEEKEKPADEAEEELAQMDLTHDTPAPITKRSGGRKAKEFQRKEEPFLPLSDKLLEVWESMRQYYGFTDGFPVKQLMARGLGSPRIYFIGSGVGEILWGDSKGLAQLVNTGVRIFTKHAPHGTECDYRLCHDGLPITLPYITKRIITCGLPDFFLLLQATEPVFLTAFSPEVREQFDALAIGCCVIKVEGIPHDEGTPPVAAVCWRARTSAHLLINKLEVKALRLILLDQDVKS